MNCDRHPQSSQVANQQTSSNLIKEIRQIPVIPRVALYIALMATIGTVMGEAKYRLETTSCIANTECWMMEPSQRRAREWGLGAMGGVFAATLISLPALL